MQDNMRLGMRQIVCVLLLGFSTCPVGAATEDTPSGHTLWNAVKYGKPMTNFRLRYEHVDQDGKPKDARAFTLRSLVGWQTTPFHGFSIGIQIINVAELDNRYDDRRLGDPEKGLSDYPVVVDPHETDINQLYLDWTGIKDTRIRIGRQQVNLDNVRFIGDIGFRQVMQVFDGYSLSNKSLPNTDIYLAHFERVKQISTRLQEGELEVVNVKHHLTPDEAITGYAYLSNFETPSMAKTSVLGAGTDQSSKTLGLRIDGNRRIGETWRGLYTVEYARQSDYSEGDDRIDAHYGHIGAGISYRNWFARVDHERLSSNDGEYAFQTPFGTNHLFQGWADHFLITPSQGIKDTFITLGGKPLPWLSLHAEYHIINAHEWFSKFGGGFGDKYGKEIDLAATWSVSDQLLVKAEYANFWEADRIANPAGRKADIEKFWLTAMYKF